jgi:uncharacterized protein YndB with AHSA1/START domain
MPTTLKYAQTVNAPASAVFRAFTNATAYREWLSDIATLDPRPGGRFFLAWNSGYYSAGEFIKLIPEKEVQLLWSGRDDPSPTKVHVNIITLDNGMTSFTVEHFDLEDKGEWASAFAEIERGWATGIRNLLSVLENGPDLRIVNRPMMGVLFGEFDKKRAAELGVPVSEGMRIDSVVDGMGAQSAGLTKNDVIISVDGKPTLDFPSLISILQSHQSGDRVEIGLYRGADKKKVSMVLSHRPIPEIPMTPAALSTAVSKAYSQAFDELTSVLEGVSEASAAVNPAPGEWNAKEVIAHLIHNERDSQAWINDLCFSQERASDGYAGNLPARIQATVSAYSTLQGLIDEFKHAQAETVALLAALPSEFAAQKGTFWRMGYQLIEIDAHTREHIAQITAALKFART